MLTLQHKVSYNLSQYKPLPYITFVIIGPLPNTVDDFWRMIWEYKLSTIVMLIETGKVNQYFFVYIFFPNLYIA